MKTLILSFAVTFSLLEFSAGQLYQLNKITLAGGTSSTGRLSAELTSTTRGVSVSIHVPVCSSIDIITATSICQNLGYVVTTGYGTVTDLSLPGTSSLLVMYDLKCDGGSDLSQCTFSVTSSVDCDPSEEAAVSCFLTPGQVAGISIGILLFCLLLILLPVIICCCCWCGICAYATGAKRGYVEIQ